MNGDGLPNRVVYDMNYTYNPNNPQPAIWKVYFNNGRGFDAGVDWPNPSPWTTDKGNYIRNVGLDGNGVYTDVIDMNGDGLPDRVIYDRNYQCPNPPNCPTAYWKVYLNNGHGFNAGIDWPNPSPWGPEAGNYIRNNHYSEPYVYGTKADIIDMDGNGLPDRVVYDKDFQCDNPPSCPTAH